MPTKIIGTHARCTPPSGSLLSFFIRVDSWYLSLRVLAAGQSRTAVTSDAPASLSTLTTPLEMLASSSSEDESYTGSPASGQPKFTGGPANPGRRCQVPLPATLKQTTPDTSTSSVRSGQVFNRNNVGSPPNNRASVDRPGEGTVKGRADSFGYPDQEGRQTVGSRAPARYRGLPSQRSLAGSEADAGVPAVNGPPENNRLPRARANSRTFSASRSSLRSNDSSYRDQGSVGERFYENSSRASHITVH
ncbi:hypothetical protein SprV_0401638400 [Sparganum proliferum]